MEGLILTLPSELVLEGGMRIPFFCVDDDDNICNEIYYILNVFLMKSFYFNYFIH